MNNTLLTGEYVTFRQTSQNSIFVFCPTVDLLLGVLVTIARRGTLVMALAVLLSLPLAAFSAPAAHADMQCSIYGAESRWVCVNVVDPNAWGFYLLPIYPQPISPYIWVEECDGSGQNCSVVYSSITAGTDTPYVPVTAGRTYRACADFYDSANNPVYGCSPAELA